MSNAENSGIPAEVTNKFDEVFGNMSEDDKAEAGNTEVQDSSGDSGAAKQRLREEAKAQADELVEEGLETEDGQVVETPAAETPTEEKVEEIQVPAEEAAVELDANLRFAANQLGWSDEKIDSFIKANPELAAETLATLADSYTNLSRQLITGDGSQVAPGTQQQTVTPAQPDSPTSKLDSFYANLSEFAEDNGSEIVEKFLKPLKSEVLDPLKKMFVDNELRTQELNRTEARSTLTDLSKKFSDLYGENGKPVSQEQQLAVAQLGQYADQIRTAAQTAGREMSIKEALNRAHLLMTADRREREVRGQIKEQVQKRSKAITAKPTNRQNPANVNVKSDAKATEAYARKAAELGIEVS